MALSESALTRRLTLIQREAREVRETIGNHAERLDDLERKSRGTTSAHQRIVTGQRQLDRHEEAINSILERLESLGNHAGDAQLSALQAELARVNERTDALWSDINGVLTPLVGDVHELQGRVEIIGVSAASAHARLDADNEIPWWQLLVGAIVGMWAGIWWNAHDWTEETLVRRGATTTKTVVENVAASSGWAALGFGVFTGLTVFGLLWAFTGLGRSNRSTASASAGAAAAVGTTSVTPLPPRTAPQNGNTPPVMVNDSSQEPTSERPDRTEEVLVLANLDDLRAGVGTTAVATATAAASN